MRFFKIIGIWKYEDDCAGDPIVVTYTVNPCTNKVTSLMSRKGPANTLTGLNSEVSMKISPNPANSIVNIYTTGLQKDKQTILSVISVTGVILKTLKLAGSNQAMPLDVSSLVTGVYTIKIVSGDQVMYQKLVKL